MAYFNSDRSKKSVVTRDLRESTKKGAVKGRKDESKSKRYRY
ncbi:MAG: hypothetical protein WC635_10630 [Bacteriovorax sp.]